MPISLTGLFLFEDWSMPLGAWVGIDKIILYLMSQSLGLWLLALGLALEWAGLKTSEWADNYRHERDRELRVLGDNP
ncbi:MAG: hypothetical protein WDN69_29420 [Aliidongia sp.]